REPERRRTASDARRRLDLGGGGVGRGNARQPRNVAQPEAAGAKPPRQIYVLAVHENSRIESGDGVEGGATKQCCCAAYPWSIERHRVIGFGMLVGNLAQLPRGDALLVVVRKLDQRGENAGLEHAILIEDEEKWRSAPPCVRVVTATEAEVRRRMLNVDASERIVEQRHPREPVGDRRIATVVVQKQIQFQPGRLLPDTAQELRERREIRTISDDADVNGGHGTLS